MDGLRHALQGATQLLELGPNICRSAAGRRIDAAWSTLALRLWELSARGDGSRTTANLTSPPQQPPLPSHTSNVCVRSCNRLLGPCIESMSCTCTNAHVTPSTHPSACPTSSRFQSSQLHASSTQAPPSTSPWCPHLDSFTPHPAPHLTGHTHHALSTPPSPNQPCRSAQLPTTYHDGPHVSQPTSPPMATLRALSHPSATSSTPTFQPPLPFTHHSILYRPSTQSWSHRHRLGPNLDHTHSFAKKTNVEYVPVPGPSFDPYTTAPTNSLQLLKALTSAPNIERMEQLTDREMLPRFGAVHIAAAITRLPKLVRYRDKDELPSDVVSPRGSGTREPRLAHGARPRHSNAARVTVLAFKLCGEVPALAPQMFPRQIANCIWALGVMKGMGLPIAKPTASQAAGSMKASDTQAGPGAGISQEPGSLEQLELRLRASNRREFADAYVALLAALCRDGYYHLHAHVQAAEVAQLLKGMSMLPRGALHYATVHELAHWLRRNAGRAGARELATSLRSAALLHDAWAVGPEGYEAIGAALAAAAPRLKELRLEFSPINIAGVMWAYAECRLPKHLNLLPQQTVHEVYAALVEGIQPQIVMVNTQDIAMITWACARQQFRDPDLLQLLGAKAVQLLELFHPSELAQTLKALADLQCCPGDLFLATVRSVMREPDVDPNLKVDVIAKVMYAFATGGLEAAAQAAGGGEAGAAAARRQALEMLRRVRAHAVAGLTDRAWPCTVESVGLLSWALGKVRQLEAGEAEAAAGGGGDAVLMQALADAAELLVPTCNLVQLAGLATAGEALRFDGIMLAAAAANHARQLLREPLAPHGRTARRGLAAARLRQAEDILRVCDGRGLNDPELAAAVAALLVSAHRSKDWTAAEAVPEPRRLLQLLACCHRMNSAKHELRAVVSELLAPAVADADPALLAQGMAVYADSSERLLQEALSQADAAAAAPKAAAKAAPKAGKAAGTKRQAPDVQQELRADLAAMELIATALLPHSAALPEPARQPLQAAVAKAAATVTAVRGTDPDSPILALRQQLL